MAKKLPVNFGQSNCPTNNGAKAFFSIFAQIPFTSRFSKPISFSTTPRWNVSATQKN